jgi:hypothetical protein
MFIASETKAKFDEFCDANHMSQFATATALFDWFTHQPEETQKAIVGVIPKNLAGHAFALMLVSMVRRGLVGADASPSQLAELEKSVERFVDTVTAVSIGKEVARLHEPKRDKPQK